nr:hypothetical protein [Bacteroidota bacterium]
MINIKLLAFRDAPDSLFRVGKAKFSGYFPESKFDYASSVADILFFLSGGSEQEAITCIDPDKLHLLAACEENNAHAAALEVKAWMDQNKIRNLLLDLHEIDDRNYMQLFMKTKENILKLAGKRLGLIG